MTQAIIILLTVLAVVEIFGGVIDSAICFYIGDDVIDITSNFEFFITPNSYAAEIGTNKKLTIFGKFWIVILDLFFLPMHILMGIVAAIVVGFLALCVKKD